MVFLTILPSFWKSKIIQIISSLTLLSRLTIALPYQKNLWTAPWESFADSSYVQRHFQFIGKNVEGKRCRKCGRAADGIMICSEETWQITELMKSWLWQSIQITCCHIDIKHARLLSRPFMNWRTNRNCHRCGVLNKGYCRGWVCMDLLFEREFILLFPLSVL